MAGTPTQVAHPVKAILRTFVAAAVASVLALIVRVVGIDLAEFEGALVELITVAVWAVVLAAVQWALTHPTLMPFWKAVGLGTGVETENKLKPQGTEQGM